MKKTIKRIMATTLSLMITASAMAVNVSADDSGKTVSTTVTGTLGGSFYHDFTEITDSTNFTNGNTYFFSTTHYLPGDCVTGLTGDSAQLEMTAAANDSDEYMFDTIGLHPSNYVNVISASEMFDSCPIGGIVYTTINEKFYLNNGWYQMDGEPGTGWFYYCYGSGAEACGPYYAYEYTNDDYTANDVKVSLNDGDPVTTLTADNISVQITAGASTYTIPATDYTFIDNTLNYADDCNFSILVNGGTYTCTVAQIEQPTTDDIKTTGSAGGSNGTITGVNDTMEYSLDDGATWTPVTGTEITGLPAGKVLIRVAATSDKVASDAVTVTIEETKAPESSSAEDSSSSKTDSSSSKADSSSSKTDSSSSKAAASSSKNPATGSGMLLVPIAALGAAAVVIAKKKK